MTIYCFSLKLNKQDEIMNKYNSFFLTILVLFALTNRSAQAGSAPGIHAVAEQLKTRWTKLFPDDRIVRISKSPRGNGKPWNIKVYKRTNHKTQIIRYYPFTITLKRDEDNITKQIEVKYIKTHGSSWQYKGISGPKGLFITAQKKKDNKPEPKRRKPVKIKILNQLFLKLMQKNSRKLLQNVSDFPVTIVTTAFHLNNAESTISENKYVYHVYFRLQDKNKQTYYCKGFVMLVHETDDSFRGTLKKKDSGGCKIISHEKKIKNIDAP